MRQAAQPLREFSHKNQAKTRVEKYIGVSSMEEEQEDVQLCTETRELAHLLLPVVRGPGDRENCGRLPIEFCSLTGGSGPFPKSTRQEWFLFLSRVPHVVRRMS